MRIGLLILVCLSSAVVWHLADTLPPSPREARHLRASLHYLSDLGRPPRERVALLAYRRFETYPHLAYLAAIPFYLAGGTDKASAGLAITAFEAVMILSIYGIGRRLYSENAGLAAAVIAACYPTVVALSRLYVPEIPETAMVSLSVYAAVRAEGFSRSSWSLFVGIIFGLGMLCHWLYPVFAAPPILSTTLPPRHSLRACAPSRKKYFNLARAAAAAALIAAPWYISHFAEAMDLARRSAFESPRVIAARISALNSVVFYPYALAATLLFLPMTTLLLAAGGAMIWKRKASLMLLSWLVAPLAVLTVLKEREAAFFTPALPAAALITAAGLSLIEPRTLRRGLLAAAFGVSALNFAAMMIPSAKGVIDISFPIPSPDREAGPPPRTPIVRTELPPFGIGPPRREEWPLEEILEDVVRFGHATREHPTTLGWFIWPHPRLNRDCLLYYRDLGPYPIRCVPCGRGRFVLTRLMDDEQKRKLDDWARPWLYLSSLKEYPLPDGSCAVLYRSRLTRRRRFLACDLARAEGVEEVEDADATGGRARFVGRDASVSTALLVLPPQPLPEGDYRLLLRIKYARPTEGRCLARLRITTEAGARVLFDRRVYAKELGYPGSFLTVESAFSMPRCDRPGVELLHTGAADLWVDRAEIAPMAPGPPRASRREVLRCAPPFSPASEGVPGSDFLRLTLTADSYMVPRLLYTPVSGHILTAGA